MISEIDAKTFSEQLHPAFAGYLFDGEVTQSDLLACLFQMMKKGTIRPIFQNNDLTKKIVRLEKTAIVPKLEFEKKILEEIFGRNQEVTVLEVQKILQNGVLEKIIESNLTAIASFPLVKKNLRFSLGGLPVQFAVNGIPVTDLATAKQFQKVTFFVTPLLVVLGLFFTGLYFLIQSGKSSFIQFEGSSMTFLFMGPIFIFVALFISLVFKFSQKKMEFRFQNDIVPFTREKYQQLFEFLKKYPLRKHNFNNEFLPFTIAFNLDDSWNSDFGLGKELKVEGLWGKRRE